MFDEEEKHEDAWGKSGTTWKNPATHRVPIDEIGILP